MSERMMRCPVTGFDCLSCDEACLFAKGQQGRHEVSEEISPDSERDLIRSALKTPSDVHDWWLTLCTVRTNAGEWWLVTGYDWRDAKLSRCKARYRLPDDWNIYNEVGRDHPGPAALHIRNEPHVTYHQADGSTARRTAAA